PLNAKVLQVDKKTGEVQLGLGSLYGVAVGAKFKFYNSLDELIAHQVAPLATGQVTAVTAVDCTVRVENGVRVPTTARAALDVVRMADFYVGLDRDLPAPIVDKLKELDRTGQVNLTKAGEPWSVALRYDANKKSVGIYLPRALAARRRIEQDTP